MLTGPPFRRVNPPYPPDPETYLAGAVPVLLAADPPWGSEAWFARYGSIASYKFAGHVAEALAAGVGFKAMAEIVANAYDAREYDADKFATEGRIAIGEESLKYYCPRADAVLAVHQAHENKRWSGTAELIATLTYVLDYVAHTADVETALEMLHRKHEYQREPA